MITALKTLLEKTPIFPLARKAGEGGPKARVRAKLDEKFLFRQADPLTLTLSHQRGRGKRKAFKIMGVMLVTLLSNLCSPFDVVGGTRHLTPGEAGAPFMKVPLSARAAAMGEAFVAWGQDAAVTEYNPAGVAAMGGAHVTTTHMLAFQESTISGVSAAASIKRFGIGFHYRQFAAEDVARDATGAREGDIDHRDTAFQGAVGLRIGKGFGLGIGGKTIAREIKWAGSVSAPSGVRAETNSIAWDAGAIWSSGRLGALGLSIQNIGEGEAGKLSGDASVLSLLSSNKGDAAPLPQIIRLGGAHPVGRTTFVWEAMQPRDNRPAGSGGIEYHLRRWFMLRAGLRYQRHVDLSAGLGFAWSFFTFDYAFAPRVDLDNLHRATVGVRF